MIHSLEIPKENWVDFLRILNRHAMDRPVRLEVVHRELGDQEMGNLLPLREIDFETKGSARGALIVSVGSDRGELIHRIDAPKRFYLAHNEAGETESLALEDADGGKTFIYFEKLPALPAELTGEHASSA